MAKIPRNWGDRVEWGRVKWGEYCTASNGSIPHQPAENRCHISNMDLIQHVEQLMGQLGLRSFTTDEDIRACTKILSKVK